MYEEFYNQAFLWLWIFQGIQRRREYGLKKYFSRLKSLISWFIWKSEDQLCLKRLEQRSQDLPERARFDTEEVFHQVNSYFQAPTDDEEFNIEVLYQ